ncbi:tetrahydromethanopterin S-methyltransferase subunit F [Methanosarcina sp. UBA5]|uniref:tetrahydromethanopterin S-methyltransferase subunit F n=1 Tax=Methanosarcina sp. UBA5 TaxID=1915593 RepID=UPI0025FC4CD0|nr:tetrahydromethanopterin S-methyltransferase subunit F [Methanosarcina sp. UBA5]
MAEAEYGKGVPMVTTPQMGAIDTALESIRYRGQLIARNQKLDSGVMSTGISGFAAGFIFVFLVTIVIPLLVWR